LSEWSWEKCPKGLQTVNLYYNDISEFSWKNCPVNLKKCHGYETQFQAYKISKEYIKNIGKINRLIVDSIIHVNLVPSEIPVLKKYACRDYYKVIEEFKTFST